MSPRMQLLPESVPFLISICALLSGCDEAGYRNEPEKVRISAPSSLKAGTKVTLRAQVLDSSAAPLNNVTVHWMLAEADLVIATSDATTSTTTKEVDGVRVRGIAEMTFEVRSDIEELSSLTATAAVEGTVAVQRSVTMSVTPDVAQLRVVPEVACASVELGSTLTITGQVAYANGPAAHGVAVAWWLAAPDAPVLIQASDGTATTEAESESGDALWHGFYQRGIAQIVVVPAPGAQPGQHAILVGEPVGSEQQPTVLDLYVVEPNSTSPCH